ncbi:MAG: response regulator [Pseudomonadales bacterium]|nr:response regulator [Pseudomonadales bacterium]
MSSVLVVEDEAIVADLISATLEKGKLEPEIISSFDAALDKLQSGAVYDAIILDRNLPDGDGLALLNYLKLEEKCCDCPVIINSSWQSEEQILQGVQLGAYWYLTKPTEPKLLLAIVKEAIAQQEERLRASLALKQRIHANQFITHAEYQIRTLKEAKQLADGLSVLCPNPERAWLGLHEILLNAVEHGNLAITYSEKTQLILEGRLQEEIESRQQNPDYKHRVVLATLSRNDQFVEISIKDQGQGFKWDKYLDFSAERAYDPHGRGIAMSRMNSFDELKFMGCGNTVNLKMYTNSNVK